VKPREARRLRKVCPPSIPCTRTDSPCRTALRFMVVVVVMVAAARSFPLAIARPCPFFATEKQLQYKMRKKLSIGDEMSST
jgi:hypothetical protein